MHLIQATRSGKPSHSPEPSSAEALHRTVRRGGSVLAALMFCLAFAAPASLHAQSANISHFAGGLNNPRGLKFGLDGCLYVAEGGAGGDMSTVGTGVEQVLPPVGPYTGGFTARISKISPDGTVSTVVDGLPSSATSPDMGSLTSGVGDVAFIGQTLYAILSGAGESHGLANTDNAVLKIGKDGDIDLVADLSIYQKANPTAVIEEDDFEPDGTWYSMLEARGKLFAVEPNHGELVMVNPHNGKIERVADISASQGHIVPTALAYDGRDFYVGNLGTFPIVEGSAKVLKISPKGEVSTYATGFTTILGLAFDRQGRLYVLENTTGPVNLFPTPMTGKVLRIDSPGHVVEIAWGLFLPTGMTFGPDGNLYVSNVGFGPPPVGLGEIVKITVP